MNNASYRATQIGLGLSYSGGSVAWYRNDATPDVFSALLMGGAFAALVLAGSVLSERVVEKMAGEYYHELRGADDLLGTILALIAGLGFACFLVVNF